MAKNDLFSFLFVCSVVEYALSLFAIIELPVREEKPAFIYRMFELFIARRIYQNKKGSKQVSKPAVRIAMLGIAIGLAVMIVSIAVVTGFKKEIREKVIGFGSHIQVSNFDSTSSFETYPIYASDSLLKALAEVEGVSHVQRYATKPGMIKTDTDFQGMVLKGVGQEYDPAFFREHLLEGEFPHFTDSAASREVLISKTMADRLKLHLGDPVYTYYIESENVRARKFIIKGIYSTNFSEYDNLFLLTDLYTLNRLNRWEKDQASGIELQVRDYERLDDVADAVFLQVDNRMDPYGAVYYTQTVRQLNPQIFAWLDLIDTNVWVILVLMVGVAGFTMISGLLILILERTNMIGIFKALGATNGKIRRIFLWFSVFLIGRGMLIGNIIGIGLYLAQRYGGFISLDPANYYVDKVPVELHVWVLLLLNIGTLVVSVFMLWGPSYLISKIAPSRAIYFE